MIIDIRRDDLSGDAVQALVALHLHGMHATSPAESVHALDLERLRHLSVTFFAAWVDDEIAGIGALSELDAQRGEIKSMRVAEGFLGQGIGRAMLRHLIAVARERGMTSLWLETGVPADFAPATALYDSEGFVVCGPFGDYTHDPFSVFMTKTL